MFIRQEYMTAVQQIIADDFMSMVETEYTLCVREMRRVKSAIVLDTSTEVSEHNNRDIDFANREIDSISKYWQLRLGHIIEFIETKNPSNRSGGSALEDTHCLINRSGHRD